MKDSNGPLISAIRVENLFGLYNYSLPKEGVLPNAAILYGDNGLGKTTVLRLAFHLLSAANNRNHRGSLFDAPFSTLEVDLSSGIRLRAVKKEHGTRTVLDLSTLRQNTILARWIYFPGHKSPDFLQEGLGFSYEIGKDGSLKIIKTKRKDQPSYPEGEEEYLSQLKGHVPVTFLLDADRKLDGDTLPDPNEDAELRRLMRYEDSKRVSDIVRRSREVALSQALASAGGWVRKKGSARGKSRFDERSFSLCGRPSALGGSITRCQNSDGSYRYQSIK